MSWAEAQAVAARIYAELRALHSPRFVRMVLRALERLLRAAEKKDPPSP